MIAQSHVASTPSAKQPLSCDNGALWAIVKVARISFGVARVSQVLVLTPDENRPASVTVTEGVTKFVGILAPNIVKPKKTSQNFPTNSWGNIGIMKFGSRAIVALATIG